MLGGVTSVRGDKVACLFDATIQPDSPRSSTTVTEIAFSVLSVLTLLTCQPSVVSLEYNPLSRFCVLCRLSDNVLCCVPGRLRQQLKHKPAHARDVKMAALWLAVHLRHIDLRAELMAIRWCMVRPRSPPLLIGGRGWARRSRLAQGHRHQKAAGLS